MCDNTALTKNELEELTRLGDPRTFSANASGVRCPVTEILAIVGCHAA